MTAENNAYFARMKAENDAYFARTKAENDAYFARVTAENDAYFSGSSSGSGWSSGVGSASYGRGVSDARLHQKSGPSNSFGGYTKVNHGNGTFSMKKAK
jgi:hypothetical protein